MGSIDGDAARPVATSAKPASVSDQYERAATLLAVVFAFAGVALTLIRLLYGADFIDEAFYAAQAYHFALGARPFIDQFDPHQTAAFLTIPWVRLHLAIFGDTTGIMLSLRVCWAVLNGAAAILAYRLLRRFTDWRIAMLSAVSAFAVIPYMIPAPSYNSLGIILTSIATSLLGMAFLQRTGWVRYVLAGAVLGLSVFAYPTLAVAAVVAVLGVALLARTWREPALVALGIVAVGLAGLGLLTPYFAGIPSVLDYTRLSSTTYNWAGASGGGALSKLRIVLETLVRWIGTGAAGLLGLHMAVLQFRRKFVPAWIAFATVLTLPLLPLDAIYLPDTHTLACSVTVLVVALMLAFTERRRAGGERIDSIVVLRSILVFGLVVGLVYAVTSSNGWVFIGIGGAGVLAPALVVIMERLRRSLVERQTRESLPLLPVLASGCIVAALTIFSMIGSYRDLPPMQLHTLVTSGPHAGLITTQENAADSEALWAEMKKIAGPSDRILSYHGLPAGYLYSAASMALPTPWVSPTEALGAPSVAAFYVKTLSDPAHAPTIVIRNLAWPNTGVAKSLNPTAYNPDRDAVERFIEENYHTVASTPSWELLQRNVTW